MKILVAPGPFKECLSAEEVAASIEYGISEVDPESTIIKAPLCDGGTGLATRFASFSNGTTESWPTEDPLGKPIEAIVGISGDGSIAFIESATAGGLSLVPKELRNPLKTSTFGVGLLIRAAVEKNFRRIIIGCGDSATNDAGVGAAQALGVRFLDENGLEIPRGGGALGQLTKIDTSNICIPEASLDVTVACNLTSILCGPEGTSMIYARQKGADEDQRQLLDENLTHFAAIAAKQFEKDIRYLPGLGGSGGLAASLFLFLNARIRYSFDVVNEFFDLDHVLRDIDLVFTGEGMIDDRTATGKIVCAVALRAKKYGIPVIALAGEISIDSEDVLYNGVDVLECILDRPIDRQRAMERSTCMEFVRRSAARTMRFVRLWPRTEGRE
ncbi:MAG: glycerate kinase [Acidobacteria bacterium]|nr:glycerate kinase [Acidobacteriota bacterium]